MRRILIYVIGGIMALPFVVAGAILLIVSFDDELTPEVVERVERLRNESIALDDNAYFALVGLHAPAGEDFVAFGRQVYEADQARLKRLWEGVDAERRSVPRGADALTFKGETADICSVLHHEVIIEGSCSSQDKTEQMLLKNKVLLDRYYRLIDFRTLEEPFLGSPWAAGDLLKLTQLATADIEKRLNNDKTDEAANLLTKDLIFWRNLMSGKYGLISQSVIQIGIALRLHSISELALRWPTLLDNAELKSTISVPLPEETLILQAQMDRNFIELYLTSRGSRTYPFYPRASEEETLETWLADHLYRRNETLNRFHACLENFFAVRALTGEARLNAIDDFLAYEVNDYSWIANPVGELALESICPKQSWLEALDFGRTRTQRVLIALQFELLKRRIPDASVADFLNTVTPSLRHPATGKAARWEAKHRVIYFAPERSGQRVDIWVRLDTDGGGWDGCPRIEPTPCGS